MIYLDHNSTIRTRAEILDKFATVASKPLNPSSIHETGREARKILEEAREKIAKSLNIKIGRGLSKIIFTSGATEANNLIINNFASWDIFYSSIEHVSVIEPAKRTAHSQEIKTGLDGIVDLQHLEELLINSNASKKLICVMAANNETGVIQPIKKISEIAKKFGAYVHVDAVQAFGKIALNFDEMGVDFLCISAHKIGGISGIGALVVRDDFHVTPNILGGGQERSERSGTENVLGAYCFGYAAELACINLNSYISHTTQLRSYIEREIKKNPKGVIIAKESPRLSNTSLIGMKGVPSDIQLIKFDARRIMISNGSACSSGKVKDSHVLKSMGYGEDVRKSTVRVSLGIENSTEDAEKFISAWNLIANNSN